MKGLVVIIFFALSIHANSQDYGYIVTIQSNNYINTIYFKTLSLDSVKESFRKSTGLELDVEKIFQAANVVFEYRNNDLFFYCEKKKVSRKNNGQLVFRKISQRELQQLAEAEKQDQESLITQK